MRGRLIFPFVAVLARVDPAAIEAAGPGGAEGFDDDFLEPTNEAVGDAVVPIRRELAELRLRAQIEPGTFVQLRRLLAGFAPEAEMTLTLHMPELEDAGLVGADGWPTLRAGDRLARIEDEDGVTVLEIADPPGIYLDTMTPDSFGLLGSKRPNLLICALTDRPQGGAGARP